MVERGSAVKEDGQEGVSGGNKKLNGRNKRLSEEQGIQGVKEAYRWRRAGGLRGAVEWGA